MKRLIFAVFFLSLFSIQAVAQEKPEFPIRVTGELWGAPLTPHYQIRYGWIGYDAGVAYIGVEAEGDCYRRRVQRCRDSYYPPDRPWRDCWWEYEWQCYRERAYYSLPKDEIALDGYRTLEYVKDDHSIPVATKSRIPVFGGWNLKSNCRLETSEDRSEAYLVIWRP